MKLFQEKKTSAWRCLKIPSSRTKKCSCHYLHQRRYQSRSFPEPRKPLELWALAVPRLGQDREERWTEKAIFDSVKTQGLPLFPLGFLWRFHRDRAGWGGTARLRSGSRVAVPQLGDSWAFVRGGWPPAGCPWVGVRLRWVLLCATRSEPSCENHEPCFPTGTACPAAMHLSGGLSSHTGEGSFPANTRWMFPLKSFKWVEANRRRAEGSAWYQAVVCPYSAMTHKEKVCFSAQNITRSSQIDLFASTKAVFIFNIALLVSWSAPILQGKRNKITEREKKRKINGKHNLFFPILRKKWKLFIKLHLPY